MKHSIDNKKLYGNRPIFINISKQKKIATLVTVLLGSFSSLGSFSTAWALQAMKDGELAGQSGTSGLLLEAGASKAVIDNVYWQDNNTNAGRLNINNVTITKDNTGSNNNFSAQLKLNQGTAPSNTPAMSVDAKISPFLLTSQSAKLTYGTNFSSSGSSLGSISIMGINDTLLTFKNTKGIFNANGTSELNIIFNGLNLYLSQAGVTSNTTNQIIIGDIFGNVQATGKTWVDKNNGLRFSGNTLFLAANNHAGIEASVKYKGGVSTNSAQSQFAYNTATTSTEGTPVIRAAISGMVPNTQFYLQGVTTSSSAVGGDKGLSQSIFGDQGIAFRVTGEMGRQGSPFVWQLGEAGNGNNSLQFSGLVPFSNVLSTTNATFDSGSIFINQVNGTGQSWTLPENSTLTSVGTTNSKGQVSSKAVVSSSDFQQSLPDSTPQLTIQWRGSEWQAVPQSTMFITNGGTSSTGNGQWALAPLLYGVDGNVSLSGTTVSGRSAEAIQTRLQFQTKGLSDDKTKTTSVLLVDTSTASNGAFYNRYLGLRNIDTYFKGDGQLLLNNSNLQFNLANFLLGFDAQLSVGYLPGAQVYDPNGNLQSGQVGNNFGSASKNDVFYGLRGRLEGSANIQLNNSTSSNGALVFNTSLNLKNTSFFHMVEPTDSSVFGLDKVSGVIQGNNLTADLGINNGSGTIDFDGTFRFNPNQQIAEVVKVAEVNLYPKGSTTAQKLMEVAIPGGQIEASMRITPR